MKQILVLLTAFTVSLSILAQGNSGGKGKDKQKSKSENSTNPGNSGNSGNSGSKEDKEKIEKEKKEKTDHDKKIWEGTSDNGAGAKPSKNQPAKVRSSFQRDYPNATNVYWTKYRGDWTATFGNGFYRSTAIYHANGERRDTRTPILKDKLPRNVLDSIFKRRPGTRLEEAIKIEVPKTVKDIFRIKDIIQGKTEYSYYDADGKLVVYDY
jgi:hypothetical protein